ncbi:MAG TPA: TetR family transcriptional regulator C-terminal domain-containing protein [Stellaceae bacterium]|nr:TetR family transcriptional regulator C-terminal domain-containing protein [Stellaceae bacterium]
MDDHIIHMAKALNREKILEEGLKVVHERGFAAASIRDIIAAAGVPLGSFSNHFASKEAFGLEIIERYFASSCGIIARTLRNEAMLPLARLKAYIAAVREYQSCVSVNGCLLGNLAAETGGGSDAIRQRLKRIFADLREAVAQCLEAAVETGEVAAGLDCQELAGFIISSLQGAILLAKAERSLAPIDQLDHILFSVILRPTH